MKTLKEYIDIKSFLEELNSNDTNYYLLKKETDDYNLYFDKHLIKRENRHFEWDGNNKITDNKIISLFQSAYNKIVDKYQSNKLQYSTSGKEAFLITSKKYKLNLIGFIYKLNTDGKYDICLKTIMYNNDFKAKNNSNYKTIQIFVESINNIIIINED